jgi:hypothetical protein
MDIVFKYNTKHFSELEKGEVFQFFGVIYMKTEETQDYDNAETLNAVDLENGEHHSFKENAEVTPVIAVLTVQGGEE